MGTRTWARWAGAVGTGACLAALLVAPASASPPYVAPHEPPNSPALTSSGGLDLFYTGFSAAGYELIHRPGALSGWDYPRTLGGDLYSSPAAIAIGTSAKRLWAFGIGADGAVWYREEGINGWGPWATAGGRSVLQPAVSCAGSPATAKPIVYLRGTDGRLWVRDLGGGGWTALGGRLYSAPAAVSTTGGVCPGAQDVFALGSNRTVYEYRAGSWRPLGGSSWWTPTALQRPDGGTEVYVVGEDDALWTAERAAGSGTWSAWRRIGGALHSAPAVTVQGSNRVVVGLGADGRWWRGYSKLGSTSWIWHPVD